MGLPFLLTFLRVAFTSSCGIGVGDCLAGLQVPRARQFSANSAGTLSLRTSKITTASLFGHLCSADPHGAQHSLAAHVFAMPWAQQIRGNLCAAFLCQVFPCWSWLECPVSGIVVSVQPWSGMHGRCDALSCPAPVASHIQPVSSES